MNARGQVKCCHVQRSLFRPPGVSIQKLVAQDVFGALNRKMPSSRVKTSARNAKSVYARSGIARFPLSIQFVHFHLSGSGACGVRFVDRLGRREALRGRGNGAYFVCKDNTSKDPFSQYESLRGIRVQVKN